MEAEVGADGRDNRHQVLPAIGEIRLTIKERLSSQAALRRWQDKIPLNYEYTAGVAGEKFLRGLMEGKILAARCSSCGTKYLPPKMYCTKCYIEITSFRDVGTLGSLAALAQMHVDYDGKKVRRPYLLVFVSFRGVTGGMIARVSSTRAKVGSGVKARFKPKASRRGAVTDIVEFAPAR